MPEYILSKLNKLLLRFLWNNQPEAIKRKSLFNGYQNGGFNVVDIKSKIESFRIMQLLQLIKGSKAKWKYLAVYWLGLYLRKYVSSFASLTIPHSESMPIYYQLALSSFRLFEKLVPNFMSCQTVTTTFIYYNIVDTRVKPPRVVSVHPTIMFSQIWPWVQCKFVDPRYRDLAWRIAHQILPTQSMLYKYNISKNSKCYLCKQRIETLCRLFYECSVLNGLWSFAASVLLELTGCQTFYECDFIQQIYNKC